jgi:high affinity sulfate transporter 1
MTAPEFTAVPTLLERTVRIAPGLGMLMHYRMQDLPHDLVAGLSVAAVALPVGVAYAQLAGFNPAVGLYSSILPLLAYAIFGSSRQLIIGPDAATCALVAAAVAPIAAVAPLGAFDQAYYMSLSMMLALLAGLLCIGASFLKLGIMADFLSRPILVGFMNGVALSIILGQLGKLFGFTIEAGGIVPRLLEFVSRLQHTHWPTLAIGLCSFAALLVSPKLMPRLPAALVTMTLAALAVALLHLDAQGVQIVGGVPAGLPSFHLPSVPLDVLPELLGDAAGIALIVFASAMLTARSFAAKNGYDINADRDFAAIGVANIASALSQGFAVSGADSRTAMSDAAGGRTQVTGLVSAVVVALVLLFFTEPLKYVPIPALGAVLVMAALSLVDIETLRMLWRVSKSELAISIIATLGVVAYGAINAILFVVVLALLRFVKIVARPVCEVLGEEEGLAGFHDITNHPAARTIPGLCLFRFNSALVFFNAPYFKQMVLQAAKAAGPSLRWLVIDTMTITSSDVTGRYMLVEVERELSARGITLVLAGRQTEIQKRLQQKEFEEIKLKLKVFATLRQAVRAFQKEIHTQNR